MKVFIEIGEMTHELIKWLNNDEYKAVLESLNGETKEEIFRATCMILPSIILAKCQKY